MAKAKSKKLPLNPHTVGLVMKEACRRAMLEIRKQRTTFKAKMKRVGYKVEDDLVSTADTKAQKIYLRVITENYPFAGIIAEEDDFIRPCTDPSGANYYFTVDPLDGTKAYGRRQSHGVASMLALVCEGEIVAVTIGDPNSLEMYHTRPSSRKVHRIYDFGNADTHLRIDEKLPLDRQYVLLREPLEEHSVFARKLAAKQKEGGCFRGHEITGGSIGAMFARLWKGEVGAIILAATPGMTAWDTCPVVGISRKLGFVEFEVKDGELVPYDYEPAVMTPMPYEHLIVHKSRVPELAAWQKEQH